MIIVELHGAHSGTYYPIIPPNLTNHDSNIYLSPWLVSFDYVYSWLVSFKLIIQIDHDYSLVSLSIPIYIYIKWYKMPMLGPETCLFSAFVEAFNWFIFWAQAPSVSWGKIPMVSWGYRATPWLYRWMVYVMENPRNKWMRTGGTPIEPPFFSVSSHSVWILMDSHETNVSSLATQKSGIFYKKVDRWNCIRICIQTWPALTN